MLKLSRYFIRETSGLYLFGVAAVCLLLSIDLLTTWAKFLIEQDASLLTVARLMLYKTPFFLHLAMPLAIVFAVLLATGRLAKDSELKAAYSLGVNPFNLLLPMLAFAFVVSLFIVINNGYLEPTANRAYEVLEDSFFYTKPPPEVQSNVAYRISDDSIYFAGRIRADEDNKDLATLSGLYILESDGTIITAPEGQWNSETRTWLLYDAQRVETDGSTSLSSELELPFETAEDAADSLQDSSALSLTELSRRIDSVKQAGGELRDLQFAFHQRIADAFSAVIFALIAAVLGLQLHNRTAGFGWTIALIVVFWVIWTLSGQLFEQNILSARVAAWMTSGVTGVAGLVFAWWRFR